MAGLASGLMAGANFGTGFIQGQNQYAQNDYTKKMQALALSNAGMDNQQKQLSIQRQQALSDNAMAAFNPMVPGGGAPPVTPSGPAVPNAIPGQPTAATAPPAADLSQVGQDVDPSQKLNDLAVKAAAGGDMVGASELWTQAANLSNMKAQQQQRQSAVQMGELKRQQMSHAYIAQTLGAATSPEQWDQSKLQALSSPMVTPEEAQNLANLQYSPETVARIRAAGMTSSQQAQLQISQARLEEEQRHNSSSESARAASLAAREAHNKATEAAKTVQSKAGATNLASPTAEQLGMATAATKDAMGDPNIDTKDPDFLRANAAIASRALQIMKGNKAITTFPQATAIAASESQKNGEFTKTTVPGGMFSSDKTKAGFKPQGDTPANALKFTGQAKSDLSPGKFYQTGNGLMQWTGTGWKPQQ